MAESKYEVFEGKVISDAVAKREDFYKMNKLESLRVAEVWVLTDTSNNELGEWSLGVLKYGPCWEKGRGTPSAEFQGAFVESGKTKLGHYEAVEVRPVSVTRSPFNKRIKIKRL